MPYYYLYYRNSGIGFEIAIYCSTAITDELSNFTATEFMEQLAGVENFVTSFVNVLKIPVVIIVNTIIEKFNIGVDSLNVLNEIVGLTEAIIIVIKHDGTPEQKHYFK